MSDQEFRIDGGTTFRLDTGNQATGKFITSDTNGLLDWGTTTTIAQDGWTYTNNIIASGQGANTINLSAFNHHMVVNNQGTVNNGTNKVRLILPINVVSFTKIRVTLMSEPWEVYVGTTASKILYNSFQENYTEVMQGYQKGPASISTWNAAEWFKINPHNTVEFTRFFIAPTGFDQNFTTRDQWIVTNAHGTFLTS
jgi:hypothetical protein